MFRFLLRFCVAVMMTASALSALEAPKTRTILTVSGAISVSNVDNSAVFDADMLRALEWQTVETHTPFVDGKTVFSGPTLAALLQELGVEDGVLVATALDDYTVEIPVSDAFDHNVILAMEREGKVLRIRDRGPIWIVYPVDHPDQISDTLSARMIWQLSHIIVQP